MKAGFHISLHQIRAIGEVRAASIDLLLSLCYNISMEKFNHQNQDIENPNEWDDLGVEQPEEPAEPEVEHPEESGEQLSELEELQKRLNEIAEEKNEIQAQFERDVIYMNGTSDLDPEKLDLAEDTFRYVCERRDRALYDLSTEEYNIKSRIEAIQPAE